MARRLADGGRSVFVHVKGRPRLLSPGDEVPEGVDVDEALLAPADDEDQDDDSSDGGQDEGPGPFGAESDPRDYNVGDVAAYLDGLPDEHRPAEVARVLKAEQAGKNRSTLLDRYTA